MKQNGAQVSLTAEDIAEKYNARIVFKPGKEKAKSIFSQFERGY